MTSPSSSANNICVRREKLDCCEKFAREIRIWQQEILKTSLNTYTFDATVCITKHISISNRINCARRFLSPFLSNDAHLHAAMRCKLEFHLDFKRRLVRDRRRNFVIGIFPRRKALDTANILTCRHMPARRCMHFGALESALHGVVDVWSEMCGILMLKVRIIDVNRCVFFFGWRDDNAELFLYY